MSEEKTPRQDEHAQIDEELRSGTDRRRFLKQAAVAGAAAYAAPRVASAQVEAGISPVAIAMMPAEPAADSYCRYEITKIMNGGENCPFDPPDAVNNVFDVVCVDCPVGGNCIDHARVVPAPWKLYEDATRETLICEGEWLFLGEIKQGGNEVIEADCEECPDGKRGYRFI